MRKGSFWTPCPPHRAWGQRQTITIPAPAAGGDFTFTIGENYLTRVICASYTVTVTELLKEVETLLRFTDGNDHTVGISASALKQKASEAITYTAQIDAPELSLHRGSLEELWLPDLLLPPGYTLQSETEGIEGTDTVTDITLYVEQFEATPSHPVGDFIELVNRVQRLEEAMTIGTL